MTGSHQRDKSAEAFWRQLSLKEVHLYSCLFVSIRGSCSLTISRFSSNDPHRRGGGGDTYLKQDLFHSRMIRTVVVGGDPARGQTGVSQRGQAGFQRSRPPDTPHLTIGTTPPGARASRPHAVPSVAAQFPCDVAADRPAGGNRMGPAEAGRRCRLIPVEEMAEAAGGFVRAGRPRSQVGFLP